MIRRGRGGRTRQGLSWGERRARTMRLGKRRCAREISGDISVKVSVWISVSQATRGMWWHGRGWRKVSVRATVVRVSVPISAPGGVPWWPPVPVTVAVSVPVAFVRHPAVHATTRGAVLWTVVTKLGLVAAIVVVRCSVMMLCRLPVVGRKAGGGAWLGGCQGPLCLEGELDLGLEPARGLGR